MSKALVIGAIGWFLGLFMIMGNKDNPTVILITGIMMICSYMTFQATLSPMTNVLSFFMASKRNRIVAIRKEEKHGRRL